MGILKISLLTVGVLGVSMLYFGRDTDLPVDRIGQEPAIAPETIVPVSASPDIPAGEMIATANAAPAPLATVPTSVRLTVIPVTPDDTATPQSPAERAEEAARQMAASVNTTAPAPATLLTTVQDTLFVSGSTVNMRAGPSTQHDVVAKLTRGTEVIDMGPAGGGWSQIKVADTGTRGFMATRFLVPEL
ncbi:SH3 domain-containing protein [Aliiroseovarius sediminis]|uniref:SH3 domain-containing protein n=1 Tax=Aliiroseovarius sediminis TaxID=2925839 RepID=UPI001F58140F|nr:SH3 domain-containing protein [Aliiroseovarius sediminis]MCI2395858.1 SH3 domain-containing protein [Aliiroseovarius sediminis]